MENKNKLILIVLAVLFLIGIILVFLVSGSKEEIKNEPLSVSSETKAVDTEEIKNIFGQIVSIEISQIKVNTDKGDELALKIPDQGVNFFRKTYQQEKDAFSVKEIGLFDLLEGEDAEIQYDNKTGKVVMIMVGE